MVNMAFDPMMAGCLIYLIQAMAHLEAREFFWVLKFSIALRKESRPTTMGSHKDNTIVLKGALPLAVKLDCLEFKGLDCLEFILSAHDFVVLSLWTLF